MYVGEGLCLSRCLWSVFVICFFFLFEGVEILFFELMFVVCLRVGIVILLVFMVWIFVLLEEKFLYFFFGVKCFFFSKLFIGGNFFNMGVNVLFFVVIGWVVLFVLLGRLLCGLMGVGVCGDFMFWMLGLFEVCNIVNNVEWGVWVFLYILGCWKCCFKVDKNFFSNLLLYLLRLWRK